MKQFQDCKKLDFSGAFRRSPCCEAGFCHCGQSKTGEQSWWFHKKLVKLLRPYLFSKRERTVEKDVTEKKKRKKRSTPKHEMP